MLKKTVLMLLTVSAISLVAQNWLEGPLVPVWTPEEYVWANLRNGFVVTTETEGERERKFVDVIVPANDAVAEQILDLQTQNQMLVIEIQTLRDRVINLEQQALPLPVNYIGGGSGTIIVKNDTNPPEIDIDTSVLRGVCNLL